MSEAARYLRYAVPGAVFELALGLWLVIDALRYPDSAVVTTVNAAVAALVIAAAFPLGFLISNLAIEMRWLRQDGNPKPTDRRARPWLNWLCRCPFVGLGWLVDQQFRWPDDDEMADDYGYPPLRPIEAVAVSSYRTDLTISTEDLSKVGTRILAWLDLMNALAHTAVGLMLALLTTLVIVLLTASLPVVDAAPDWERLIVFALFALGVWLQVAGLARGQRRVQTLVIRYRREIQWPLEPRDRDGRRREPDRVDWGVSGTERGGP